MLAGWHLAPTDALPPRALHVARAATLALVVPGDPPEEQARRLLGQAARSGPAQAAPRHAGLHWRGCRRICSTICSMGSVSALDGVLVAVVVFVTAWWAVARQRWPAALERLSFGAVALATVTLAIEGLRWQVVPWQGLALAAGLAAGLRRWRPGRTGRWGRRLGRLGLLFGLLAGAIGLGFARVPTLPQPTGPHAVGSQVFRWTGPRRAGLSPPTPGRGAR